MNYWFLIGMGLFFAGQIIRAVRWQILLPENMQHEKRKLLLYTSIGSLLNTVVPLRMGDLIRASLLSKGIPESRFSTSLTSVLIERMTDGILIALIILVINTLYPASSLPIAAWMLIVPGIIVSTWILISKSNNFKKLIFLVSSLWNTTIQISILDFFWTLNLQIKYKRYLSWHYLLASALMWGSYFSSYACFANTFPQLLPIQIFQLFHSENLNGSLTTAYEAGYSPEIIFGIALFLLTPLFFVFLYSVFFRLDSNGQHTRGFLRHFSDNLTLSNLGLPSSFSGKGGITGVYSKFLHSHFSNRVDLLSILGSQGFEDCKIARVFHGGSGAITAVIEKSEGLSIRKVANFSEAQKLEEQYFWLESASKNNLPATKAFNFVKQPAFCFYEMPYVLGSLDMYEWIHAVPIDSSSDTLKNIIEVISYHHEQNSKDPEANDTLDEYLSAKVIQNIDAIRSIVSQLIDPYDFTINGIQFSIQEWSFLENIDFIKSILVNKVQTDIHGDLTIDNLIVDSSHNWTLIDPNPSTIYKSALMDWGKLLQSLHTGYEFLDRHTEVAFNQKSIRYLSYRSDKYQALYSILLIELEKRYGKLGTKQAFLHEIIHYLRLLPYKFKVNDKKGLLFFAVTCNIIRDFKECYEIS